MGISGDATWALPSEILALVDHPQTPINYGIDDGQRSKSPSGDGPTLVALSSVLPLRHSFSRDLPEPFAFPSPGTRPALSGMIGPRCYGRRPDLHESLSPTDFPQRPLL